MKHPDSSRFSNLLEGDLAPVEVQELEKHLSECEACSSLLRDLRAHQQQARELPDRFPSRDLWPGIAAAIQEEDGQDPHVIRLHPAAPAPARPWHRRFHLTVPQAVAAGLVLAIFSGVVGARIDHRSGSPTEAFGEPTFQGASSSWVGMVREATPDLEAMAVEVAGLEEVLAQRRGDFDPLTIEIVEKNLGIIDGAIRESVSALRADPGNRFLENNLERAILAKGEYLRDAAFLVIPVS